VKVGLALSGGAARGIAHIGVLKYLEERGVEPCCIAGTSAGSIVGALYCSGRSVDQLIEIAAKMSWKDLVKISLPHMGLIRSSLLLKMLKEYLGDITFEELKLPLIVNAVDLLKGEKAIFTEGPVAEAVAASCAIPGIFSPVRLKNRLLVDGGVIDNMPSNLLVERGIEFVIAVDVTAQRPLIKEPDNIFEVLIQSYDILIRQRDLPAKKHADILIEPELGDYNFWETRKSKQLIKQGYKAAAEALDKVDLKKEKNRFFGWLRKNKR
jgi:NTE family protein